MKTIKIQGWKIKFYLHSIEIGCQTISNRVVRAIARQLNNSKQKGKFTTSLSKKVKDKTWFSAIISGTQSFGRIRREKERIFLCQNTNDGAKLPNLLRLNFKYSWVVDQGTKRDLEDVRVTQLFLYKRKSDYQEKKINFKSYQHPIIIYPGYIVCCGSEISNKKIRTIVSKLKS